MHPAGIQDRKVTSTVEGARWLRRPVRWHGLRGCLRPEAVLAHARGPGGTDQRDPRGRRAALCTGCRSHVPGTPGRIRNPGPRFAGPCPPWSVELGHMALKPAWMKGKGSVRRRGGVTPHLVFSVATSRRADRVPRPRGCVSSIAARSRLTITVAPGRTDRPVSGHGQRRRPGDPVMGRSDPADDNGILMEHQP